VVLTQGEHWAFVYGGNETVMNDPNSDHRKQAAALLASVEFLEPTASRLKSHVPPNASAPTPRPGRHYIEPKLGLRFVLGPDWVQTDSPFQENGRYRQVTFHRAGTLAYISLMRQVLETSPTLFRSNFEKSISLTDLRAISE
jgi:hypothetical protein